MASTAQTVFEHVRARRAETIERMMGAATAHGAWPPGPLDLGPCAPAPTVESAESFLTAVEAWVLDEDHGPIAAWLSWPRPAGLLGFTAVVREVVLAAADEVGGEIDGICTAAHVGARLEALLGMLSARLDAVLAREEGGIRALAWQLEGAHSLASPLNVITLQAGLTRMKLELGVTDGALASLEELTRAIDRLIDERRRLSERTATWCHRLRRAMKDTGALEDQ